MKSIKSPRVDLAQTTRKEKPGMTQDSAEERNNYRDEQSCLLTPDELEELRCHHASRLWEDGTPFLKADGRKARREDRCCPAQIAGVLVVAKGAFMTT